MSFISGNLTSFILIVGTIFLILQEDFLIEKVPFILFYSCKLLAKTLGVRSRFKRRGFFGDSVFLWLVCFGKKTIIDLTYYHINWLRYMRYSLVLLAIDFAVWRLEVNNVRAKSLLNIKPFKAFLLLTSGICDSISLENLLWRNHINGWHLDVSVFIFVVLDPFFYTVFAWLFQGQKKEKNFSACQKNMNFGVFLAMAHYFFSLQGYSLLIEFRRKIPFDTSNVVTPAVGMRLLNCFSYVLFVTYSIITESSPEKSSFNVEKEIKNQELKKEVQKEPASPDPSILSDTDVSVTKSPAKAQKIE